jgi:hypothetical protein
LLSGTGLVIHSLANLYSFPLGFDPGRVLAVALTDRITNRPAGQAAARLSTVTAEAWRLPGVEATAMASQPPLTGSETGIHVVAEDGRRRSDAPTHAFFTSSVARLFATLGVRLLGGRECSTTPLRLRRR